MGSYARCKSCNANIYLNEQKNQLRYPVSITCFTCGNTNSHYVYEITQERHDYQCPFCKKNYYILKPPPIQIQCPHCNSRLYIESDGAILQISTGKKPDRQADALGGLLGGAAIGSVLGPAGILLGGLLGGALGYGGTAREAIYENGL